MALMAGEVTIAGHRFRTWEVWAAVTGGAAVTWFAWKQHKASQASAAPGGQSGTDPVTGLPYSMDSQVDPATGLAYLQEAQEYGSVAAADSALAQSSAGYAAYSGAYAPYSGLTGLGSAAAGTMAGPNYTSNAEWAQAVEGGLTDVGYASTDVAAALGRYLAGLSLTPDQATIVNAAVAEYGPPPSGQFQVILAPAAGTVTTGTGTGTAAPAQAPPGFSASGWARFGDFGWGTVPDAQSYELLVVGQGGRGTGTSHVDQWIQGTHAEGVQLTPGAYKAQARAWNAAGGGPWSQPVYFTVKS
jgi:hypothetical protein